VPMAGLLLALSIIGVIVADVLYHRHDIGGR
jgi:hypothetical protein